MYQLIYDRIRDRLRNTLAPAGHLLLIQRDNDRRKSRNSTSRNATSR
jgi:hypothetical protein